MPLNLRVITLRFLVQMKRSIFDLLMFRRFVRQLDSVAEDVWIERLRNAEMTPCDLVAVGHLPSQLMNPRQVR